MNHHENGNSFFILPLPPYEYSSSMEMIYLILCFTCGYFADANSDLLNVINMNITT